VEKEIAPFHAEWEEQGHVDRAVWNKAGENGCPCMTMPEEFGGSEADKLYSVIQMEELARGGFSESAAGSDLQCAATVKDTVSRACANTEECPVCSAGAGAAVIVFWRAMACTLFPVAV
jgi:alkylation response protein AidB-like acyl-CoA dehydrogenase